MDQFKVRADPAVPNGVTYSILADHLSIGDWIVYGDTIAQVIRMPDWAYKRGVE